MFLDKNNENAMPTAVSTLSIDMFSSNYPVDLRVYYLISKFNRIFIKVAENSSAENALHFPFELILLKFKSSSDLIIFSEFLFLRFPFLKENSKINMIESDISVEILSKSFIKQVTTNNFKLFFNLNLNEQSSKFTNINEVESKLGLFPRLSVKEWKSHGIFVSKSSSLNVLKIKYGVNYCKYYCQNCNSVYEDNCKEHNHSLLIELGANNPL